MSETNRDEAVKCYTIAQNALKQGDEAKAVRFLEKSLRMYATKEAKEFLDKIRNKRPSGESNYDTQDASSSSTRTTASVNSSASTAQSVGGSAGGGARQRTATTSASSESPPYTKAQEALCKEVLEARDIYAVLKVKRAATEEQIRKAYRKLAMQLHPDKNRAPSATEAFKKISKAFQLLSDPQKRAKYDQYGDEDEMVTSRNGGGEGVTMDGFMTPEELFQAFFGFGGGGGATIFTGPGGTRVYRQGFRHNHHQQRAENMTPAQQRIQALMQLLPLVIIIFFSFFGGSFFGDPTPDFRLTRTGDCNNPLRTEMHNVPFYATSRFQTNYPRNTLIRQEAEAEVEYTYFYRDCWKANQDIRKDLEYFRLLGAQSKVRELSATLLAKEEQNPACNMVHELRKKFPAVARKVNSGRSQVSGSFGY